MCRRSCGRGRYILVLLSNLISLLSGFRDLAFCLDYPYPFPKCTIHVIIYNSFRYTLKSRNCRTIKEMDKNQQKLIRNANWSPESELRYVYILDVSNTLNSIFFLTLSEDRPSGLESQTRSASRPSTRWSTSKARTASPIKRPARFEWLELKWME